MKSQLPIEASIISTTSEIQKVDSVGCDGASKTYQQRRTYEMGMIYWVVQDGLRRPMPKTIARRDLCLFRVAREI